MTDSGPTLHWEGKAAPSADDLASKIRPLREMPNGVATDSGGLLIRADARDAAAWLLRDLEGQVDLIYIDPPFLVGNDFLARVGVGAPSEAQFAYCDRWPSPDDYLCFIHHLVALSHRLLAHDGSMYLHVDRRTSHWAKCILAEVFGPEQDRGTIAWQLGNGVKSKQAWGCSHNDILVFSKGDAFKFRSDRPSQREPYAQASLETHFRSTDEQGRRYRDRTVNDKTYRYFADEGRQVGSVWTDCPSMSARSPIMGESTGYPTQKPEKLLERIIEASSDTGDLVVDLCCGSGTTPAVAQRLGRRWIAADIGQLAISRTRSRVDRLMCGQRSCVIDLVPIALEPANDLMRLLGCEAVRRVGRSGLVGQVGSRVLAVWPHGVVPSTEDCADAFEHAPDGVTRVAFATAFEPSRLSDQKQQPVECYRYHPEAAYAASLRSQVFATEHGGILRITPSSGGGDACWTVRQLALSEIIDWRDSEADDSIVNDLEVEPTVKDVFGFRHTMTAIAGLHETDVHARTSGVDL